MVDHVTEPSIQVSRNQAASLATNDVPIAHPDFTVAELVALIRRHRFKTISDIPVLDGQHFAGMIRLEDLLTASDEMLARDLISDVPLSVNPTVDQEVAVWQASQRHDRTIAVVAPSGQFVGMIPTEQMVAVLLTEHDEDMARLGGYTHEQLSARSAAEERVTRRLKHRLPWLMVGLVGALLAAGIIASFEGMLSEHVMLLFFIPSVVYLADAVGTQTETIVIRGLSVGVALRGIVRRELLTGLLAGITIAAVFFPVSFLFWQDLQVSMIVALSIVAACAIATVVATVLPHMLQRIGSDPAFGSGPLATVIQDLLSVSLFLLIALIFFSI